MSEQGKTERKTNGNRSASDAEAFMRPPSVVMRLARMGSAHPTRLSFLRILFRRMRREGWRIDRPLFDMDERGVGRAVYRARGPERTYSLVAFSHDLPDEMRSDRVIATAWDATFALFDGEPTSADIDRLEANVPLQEAGRVSQRELSLSRANRSVRLFAHVVESLAQGRQPDPAEVAAVGYLMRTTAVYGAGKFGAADREIIADRDEMRAPFQAEMLSVWLTREFTVDIVEHLAAIRGGDRAVRLSGATRQLLGVGNSTGLGMAPFLVRHPLLLNNWMETREKALAQVRARQKPTGLELAGFQEALAAAIENADAWQSEHELQVKKLEELRRDLALIAARTAEWPSGERYPWDELWNWGEKRLSLEGQEALLSLMLEPHGEIVDELENALSADEQSAFRIDGAMSVGDMRDALRTHYRWALSIDFRKPESNARFWYVSEEKLEPRLGSRHEEEGGDLEQPLCTGRLASELYDALNARPRDELIGVFLMAHPRHRYMVRRVQITMAHPYAEVQDNLTGEDLLPIDLMRCKLAFFGASHFDPRSDRWVRISMFRGEEWAADINGGAAW